MVISQINTKGGVGKTTTTIALQQVATAELGEGARILMIDASQESNLTSFFELDPVQTKEHNLRTFMKYRDSNAIFKATEQSDLIPATLENRDDSRKVADKLKGFPEGYAHTFVDCQPTMSALTTKIATLSDMILVPCDMELWSLESSIKVINGIKAIGQEKDREIDIMLLPTKYDKWRKSDRDFLDTIQEHITVDILPPIRFAKDANTISGRGMCIEHKKLMKDYTNIWREICDRYTRNRTTTQPSRQKLVV